MTAEGDNLPDSSRVLRYVPYARMRTDEDGNFLGPNPNAFMLRDGEDYLSVTWCEYFVGSANEQLRCSVEAIRNSSINVRPMACFCFAKALDVVTAIQRSGRKGRAIYCPENDNAAHAGIYGIAPDDALLVARLADEVWCEYLSKDTADALPISDCSKSMDVE